MSLKNNPNDINYLSLCLRFKKQSLHYKLGAWVKEVGLYRVGGAGMKDIDVNCRIKYFWSFTSTYFLICLIKVPQLYEKCNTKWLEQL